MRPALFVSLCIAILCGPAVAAPVNLGPEVPLVSQIRSGPAAYPQYTPVVASNGRDFLAVWPDEREQTTFRRLYGTRIDAEGRPAEPFGRKVATLYYAPMLASNGDDYLLMWSRAGIAPYYLQPLDEDGSPAGAQRELDATLSPLALTSNGRTYLLIARAAPDYRELIAVSLDRDGVILDRKPLRLSSSRSDGSWPFSAGISNGRYVILGYEPSCFGCPTTVLRTVDEHNGTLTVSEANFAFNPPVDLSRRQYYANPVVTPDRILYSWVNQKIPGSISARELQFIIVDHKGNIAVPLTTLPLEGTFHQIYWDGSEFLLTWYEEVNLYGLRIRPDGSMPSSQQWSASAAWLPVFASNGTGSLLLWADTKKEVRGRFVRSLSELAIPRAEDTLIASSGRPQTNVQIAAIGNRTMAVWSDQESRQILAAVSGEEILVAEQPDRAVGAPSITAGRSVFLVAWYERETSSGTDLLFVRHYSLNGVPFDPSPLFVRRGRGSQPPGVTADGDAFVIANTTEEALPGRYTVELLRLEGNALWGLWTYSCGQSCWGGSLAPMKRASEWVVPYMYYVGFFSPHVENTYGISLLSMPLSGTGARTTATGFIGNAATLLPLGAAQAGEQLAFTIRSSNSITLLQQFSATAQARSSIPAAGVVATDIAWNGSEYVLAWTTADGGPIRAIRLDVNGRPIDSAPFDVATEGSTIAAPSVVATGRGVVIAYSRSDRANGGAPRAFQRTLDALPPLVTRRPAARH